MHDREQRSPIRRAAGWTAALVIVALSALCFWPGLYADWGRDDFMQLAMARMVDTPWVFFTTDHFPVPSTVFRPVGFASFWLSWVVAGTEFWPHALLNLGLYAAIALALFGALRAFRVDTIPAFLATLLFALHPVAIGTGLWWSARFDLLATLFALIALRSAARTTRRPPAVPVALTLLWLMAAMLSKEIGLIGVAAVMVVWLDWAWRDRQRRRPALIAAVLCAVTALAFLAWRAAVLDTAGSIMTSDTSLLDALFEGISVWLSIVAGYIGFQAQSAMPGWILSAVALLALLLGIAAWRLGAGQRRAPGVLLLAGALLLFLPGLIQAPVARLNAQPLSAGMSAVEAAMQSRLYFMSLAGLSMLAAWLLQAALPSPRRPAGAAAVLAIAILVGLFGHTSHQQAAAFARVSSDNARIAHEAVAALAEHDWPPPPCHLVFEDIEPPLEWSIYVSMDSVIKALHPDLEELDHCFIHANYPTFFHLLATEHANAPSAPLPPLQPDGQPLERRRLGGLTIVYLQGIDALEPEEYERLPRP